LDDDGRVMVMITYNNESRRLAVGRRPGYPHDSANLALSLGRSRWTLLRHDSST